MPRTAEKEKLEPGKNPQSGKLAKFWRSQIEDFTSAKDYKRWLDRGDKVIRRFRDERTNQEMRRERRLNVLWANYKVLKPALYGKVPLPVIERKFLQHDPVGRVSSTMLERATKTQIGENGLHLAVGQAVSDYLLPGRGVCWVRYEPEIGFGDSIPVQALNTVEDDLDEIAEDYDDTEDEDSEEVEKLESTGEQLLAEQAPVDYIDWKDFLYFPTKARNWTEVQAVGKRVFISKKEAKERFGEEIATQLKPDNDAAYGAKDKTYNTSMFEDINQKTITVYEIWNKADRRVYWVSFGYDYLCDVKDDPLKLKKFFPVPMPLDATLTNDVYIPVPDYWEYQDQAIQIDEITQRLALLTQACKVAGTYDASNGPLKRLLDEGVENELLPVDAWAAFAEKGGVKGGISFLPIDEIQKVIQTLQQVRQQLMQDLDLVTGITDIQRGTTDSRETLGGIRLKNNNTGTRLSERQNEVARFVRDIIAIVAEIIAKHFDDKTIIQSSGILFDDEMQPESIEAEIRSKIGKKLGNQQQGGPPALGPPAPPQAVPPNMMQGMLAPPPIPGAPSMQPGMGASPMGGPPQQPQNNVIPFPGGPPQPQPQQEPQQLDPATMPLPPELQPENIIALKIEKAMNLIRSDVPRGYRIDIETDSTIFGDAAQERQDAVEFIQGVTGFLQAAAAIAEKSPAAMPMLGRMLQFGVRKFRSGRDLESSIDTFVRKMDKDAKDMEANPKPSPEEMEMQAEMQKQQLTIQGQKQQNDFAMQQKMAEQKIQEANDARDFQKQQAEDQREMMKSKAEDDRAQQMAQIEMSNKAQQAQLEMAQKEREHQIRMEELALEKEFAKAAHEQKMKELTLQAAEKKKQREEKAKKPKGKAA